MTDGAEQPHDESRLETLCELLADEYNREILRAASVEPVSASELSERCGVSQTTIYRRLEQLTSAGMLGERTRPRADGHHDTVYVATMAEFSVALENGELRLAVTEQRDDIADRLTSLWEEF
jgi:predicted transcriptional regulator